MQTRHMRTPGDVVTGAVVVDCTDCSGSVSFKQLSLTVSGNESVSWSKREMREMPISQMEMDRRSRDPFARQQQMRYDSRQGFEFDDGYGRNYDRGYDRGYGSRPGFEMREVTVTVKDENRLPAQAQVRGS